LPSLVLCSTETWPSASAQARHHAGYSSPDAYARYSLYVFCSGCPATVYVIRITLLTAVFGSCMRVAQKSVTLGQVTIVSLVC
jgi:hypothetical protein